MGQPNYLTEMRLAHEPDDDARICPRCARGYLSGTNCDLWPDRVHVGDHIRIPKGAIVHSFHPKKGPKPAGKTYRVTVAHFIGMTPRWPGSSGYWTWAERWERV